MIKKLTSPKEIKEVLKEHEISLKKNLGQNFLVSEKVMQTLLKTASVTSKDTVLEVGPGLGVLTIELIQKALSVIAIEKDEKMTRFLKEALKDAKNLEIITGDALKEPLPEIPYKMVSNLPYYIVAPMIRRLLEADNKPKDITLIVQKEVGQRICAKPPRMSILAVSTQLYATPTLVTTIKKGAFWPQPQVDSAILKLTDIHQPDIDTKTFFKIVKAGFSSPRKQLVNNFSSLAMTKEEAESWLSLNNIKSTQRAETLSVKDWTNLAESMSR